MSEWFRGFSVAVCLNAMTQDLMGKEQYLEVIRVGWINTHWQMWALFIVLLLVAPLIEKHMIIRNMERRTKHMKDFVEAFAPPPPKPQPDLRPF